MFAAERWHDLIVILDDANSEVHYAQLVGAESTVEPDASAFIHTIRTGLDRVFSIQSERTVNRNNTIKYKNLTLQIDKQTWRSSMEGCPVTVYQYLEGTITVGYRAPKSGA